MANRGSETYVNWLMSEIGNETTYHGHKETMAWVATALYIPGIIGLTQLVSNSFPWWVFVVAFFLVMVFVSKQFHLRAKSADTNDALRKLIQDVFHGRDLQVEDFQIQKGKHWPRIVEMEIETMKGHGRSWKTTLSMDWVSYGAITLATFAALCLLKAGTVGYVTLICIALPFFVYFIYSVVKYVRSD